MLKEIFCDHKSAMDWIMMRSHLLSLLSSIKAKLKVIFEALLPTTCITQVYVPRYF